MEPVDNSLAQTTQYGGFWPRLGAVIIDALVLGPFTFGVTYLNVVSWKSLPLLFLVSLAGLIYKPFMELYYGATLGKMALNLKVVNERFEQASMKEIVLRNIFHIGGTTLTLLFTMLLFQTEEFQEVTGFFEYSKVAGNFALLSVTNNLIGLIMLVDGIILIADSQKRSLHDKIASTYVIERAS